MAITRLFRVRIDPVLRTEFEERFADISVRTVEEAPGFISCSIHRPTAWSPDEYLMISRWKDEAALVAFAGQDWDRPVIPPVMERFVRECSVHHYLSWEE
jgi:heme-degrading monooxygenase HmoA